MIPRVVHFVFGLRPQDEPFHPLHYVAIESCRRVLEPKRIHFHYRWLPFGAYWDLARPSLTLHRVELVPEVLAADYGDGWVPQAYRYAHHADFVRLDALIEHGGAYADIDTVFLRPFPASFWDRPFVIGREGAHRDERSGEDRPSLCNALLLSEPGSTYAVEWRRRMAGALDGTWSGHAGFLAERLSRELPGEVHVEPAASFYPAPCSPEGIRDLLEGEVDTRASYSVHLWGHLWWDEWRRDFSRHHAGTFTVERLREGDGALARLAGPYLPEVEAW